ncbi:hypothetical protein GC56T2_1834 [Geobacillus sp. C56-T2]|nr:hypothetical protein GC56T2_1834 [Geobacillus sp. C56-T2]
MRTDSNFGRIPCLEAEHAENRLAVCQQDVNTAAFVQ